MPRLFSVFLLLAAAPVVAAETKPDSYETERLERSCAIERESLLRERNGTPACDRLDRLYGRPPKAEPVVVVVPQERDRDQAGGGTNKTGVGNTGRRVRPSEKQF